LPVKKLSILRTLSRRTKGAAAMDRPMKPVTRNRANLSSSLWLCIQQKGQQRPPHDLLAPQSEALLNCQPYGDPDPASKVGESSCQAKFNRRIDETCELANDT